MVEIEIECINIKGFPTEEVYVCKIQAEGYTRIIPLYRLIERDRLIKLDILFRDCRVRDDWLKIIGLNEQEILKKYFESEEGRAEKLFIDLVNAGVIPKPVNGKITFESRGIRYEIDVNEEKLFVNGKERCFTCKEDLPKFDRIISLYFTLIHSPENLRMRE
ncbi:hypothetical protein DRP05_02195 [Archaeoglobales archaeon]|nr:MAG: hypothetical protein DRP05_02195 [Archaeoglobales archaeon]